MKKNRGLFARVLVDIDLLSSHPNLLLVKRSGFTFIADVEYKWLRPFFSNCKMIGHELAQCHVIHAQGGVNGSQHKSSQKKIPDEQEQGNSASSLDATII